MGFETEQHPNAAYGDLPANPENMPLDAEQKITQIGAEIQELQESRDENGNELYAVTNPIELTLKIYALRNTPRQDRLLVTDFDKALTDHTSKPCFAALGIPPNDCTPEEQAAITKYKTLTSLEYPTHRGAINGLKNTLPTDTTLAEYNQQQFSPGNVVSDAINSLYDVLIDTGILAAHNLFTEAPELIEKLVQNGPLRLRAGIRNLLTIFGEVVVVSGGITEIIEGILQKEQIAVNAIIANPISQPPNIYNYVTPTNKPERLRQYIQEQGMYAAEGYPLHPSQATVLLGDDPNDMCIDREIQVETTLKILLHTIPHNGQVREAYPGYPDYDIMIHKTEDLARIAHLLDPDIAAVL